MAQLVKAWESKNAQRAARGAGLGLMAVSLAACGGSDDSSTSTPTTPVTPPVTPISAALTIGVDNVVGTSANDTISGARVDGVQTWNSSDKIAGGAGVDSFTAVIDADVTPVEGGVTGVENITVTLVGTAAGVVTFGSGDGAKDFISGVQSITNLASSAQLTFAQLQEIPTITLNNTGATTVVSFADGVLEGTADKVTLNVNGNTGTVTLTPSTGEDIETLTVNATGAASTVTAAGVRGDTVKAVVVTGDADLSFDATASFHKAASFDGSAASGDLTAVFATYGSGTTNTSSIKTGSGDDSITISAVDSGEYSSISVATGAGKDTVVVGTRLSTKHTIDGGAGKDTLSIDTGATSISVSNVTLVNNQTSNFEVMSFANRVDVLDASSFRGFTDYVFTQASTNTAGTDISGLTSANKLTFKANLVGTAGNVGGATTAAAASNALKLTAAGTAQTVTIVADATTAPLALTGGIAGAGEAGGSGTAVGAAAAAAIGFGAGVTALNIVADTNLNITGGQGGAGGASSGGAGGAASAAIANGTDVKTVTISGDGDVTIAGGAVGAPTTGGGASGAASTNGFTGAVTVNASALKGVLNIQGSAGEDAITGGLGNDVIRAGGSNDTVTLTAGGSDKVVFEANAGANAVDTIIGFKAGATASGGDVLDFLLNSISSSSSAAAPTAGANFLEVDKGSAAGTFTAEAVIVLDFGGAIGAKDFGSAAGFAEIFGAGKTFAATMTASKESILVVQGTDETHIYHVVNDSTAGLLNTEVSLIGELSGVTNADTLVAGNFLI